jgi:hypothetical protein
LKEAVRADACAVAMKSAAILALLVLSAGSAGAPAPRTPVLVELFTSEGCSSCPPADALLGRLLREQPVPTADIVPLELHVDYWDQLGWKDPFASRVYTDRQQAYARALGVDDVYTPQMVVDGRAGFVGSDQSEARKAITAAADRPHLPLHVSARGVGTAVRVTVDLPAAPKGEEKIEVIAALTEDDLASAVRRGENSGRTLQHAAVVRKLQPLGALDLEAAVAEGQMAIDRAWKPDRMRAIVWLQGEKTRHVYAVAAASIEGAGAR